MVTQLGYMNGEGAAATTRRCVYRTQERQDRRTSAPRVILGTSNEMNDESRMGTGEYMFERNLRNGCRRLIIHRLEAASIVFHRQCDF